MGDTTVEMGPFSSDCHFISAHIWAWKKQQIDISRTKNCKSRRQKICVFSLKSFCCL